MESSDILTVFGLAGVMFVAITFMPVPTIQTVSAQNQETKNQNQGLQILRTTSRGTVVYKFEDGLNTCYLTDNFNQMSHGVTAAASISCIRR